MFLSDENDKDVLFRCFLINIKEFKAFVCLIKLGFSIKIVRDEIN